MTDEHVHEWHNLMRDGSSAHWRCKCGAQWESWLDGYRFPPTGTVHVTSASEAQRAEALRGLEREL